MSHQEPSGALEMLNQAGQGVRVEFHKSGDLFWHAICVVCGDRKTAVLRSVTGNGSEVPPDAPCFAELHQQGETVFLTGANSAGHWSMSAQIAKDRQSLALEVACRLKKPSHEIGSTYATAESFGCRLDDAGANALVVDRTGDTPCLQLSGTDPNCCLLSTDGGRILRLYSPEKPPESLPATVQWRYAVGLC